MSDPRLFEKTSDQVDVDAAGVNRRTVLKGAGLTALVGITGAGLAACSTDPQPQTPAEPAPPESIDADDVPIGSGRVTGEYVVTQPNEGDFRGYSAICPHQGCKVTVVKQENIVCQCHGSTFSIYDGSVTGGPSKDPLPAAPVTVSGATVEVGGR